VWGLTEVIIYDRINLSCLENLLTEKTGGRKMISNRKRKAIILAAARAARIEDDNREESKTILHFTVTGAIGTIVVGLVLLFYPW